MKGLRARRRENLLEDSGLAEARPGVRVSVVSVIGDGGRRRRLRLPGRGRRSPA